MAKFSTGLRDILLGTQSFKDAMTGCTMKLYSGAEPLTADAAVTGVLLGVISDDGTGTELAWGPVAGGIIRKATAQTWRTAALLASGKLGYFRIAPISDTGNISLIVPRVQGLIGLGSGDMSVAVLDVVSGAEWAMGDLGVALPSR